MGKLELEMALTNLSAPARSNISRYVTHMHPLYTESFTDWIKMTQTTLRADKNFTIQR